MGSEAKGSIPILQVGVGFLFLFTAFQTDGFLQPTILAGLGFHDLGFQSLAIVYGVFSVANFIAPAVVFAVGTKWALVLAALTYCAFTAALIHVVPWVFLCASALLGVGAAVLWTAQGSYVTGFSKEGTLGRNMGITWALTQSSIILGSATAYLAVPPGKDVSEAAAARLFAILLGISTFGVLILCFLRPLPVQPAESEGGQLAEALRVTRRTVSLLGERDIGLLALPILYNGLEIAFYSSKIGSVMGGQDTTLPPLSDAFSPKTATICLAFLGAGEFLGGMSLGRLGDRVGQLPVFVFCVFLQLLSFLLCYANFIASWWAPLPILGHVVAFILGFGDAGINATTMAELGSRYRNESTSAFALRTFYQSLAASIAYVYSGRLSLQYQLLLLSVAAFAAVASYLSLGRRRPMEYLALPE
eukprot:comp16369_c0_seq1/m.14218 comp16369_c0_seq1/g.14218  ORF comp16369_c0_seq1/g.14218 comp16369_c0_seq1/m.14218 type:complete len:418 (-) comp16369_c0_seq1:18-1271(-)